MNGTDYTLITLVIMAGILLVIPIMILIAQNPTLNKMRKSDEFKEAFLKPRQKHE